MNVDMFISELINEVKRVLNEQAFLRSRAIISLLFKPISLIRVGRQAELARLPILLVRTVNGVLPVIPESTWRGSMRSIGEAIAKTLSSSFKGVERLIVKSHYEEYEGTLRHKVDLEFKKVSETELIGKISSKVRSLGVKFSSRLFPDEPASLRECEHILSMACPICRLWGGLGYRGKLVIGDTTIEKAKVHNRTHVSINRCALVRMEGALFTVEYLYTNNSIKLEIIAENLQPKTSEAKIFAATLGWITKLGLSIGGFKSRGAGHLKLDEEKSQVYLVDYDIISKEQLVKALTKPKEVAERMSVKEYITYLVK